MACNLVHDGDDNGDESVRSNSIRYWVCFKVSQVLLTLLSRTPTPGKSPLALIRKDMICITTDNL